MLTFATSTSYNFFTAPLILGLFARTSTMNTSVLLSSIFFMADSVVKGCLMMANWSSLFVLGIDTRGYLGCRGNFKVFGRWKWTDVLTFRFAVDFTPLRTAFFALLAEVFSAALAPPLLFWAEQKWQQMLHLDKAYFCKSKTKFKTFKLACNTALMGRGASKAIRFPKKGGCWI